MATTTNTKAARGTGRYYYRIGVRKELAVRYATTLHPEMVGLEDDIRAGWSAERRLVRGQ